MPHLTLQYSANLAPLPARPLLQALNSTLLASGHFSAADIKSRALRLDDYLVGCDADEQGFIHLQLDLLDGRSDADKARLSAALLQTLEQSLPALPQPLQLCVELRDIHRASYAKSWRT